MLFKIEMGDWSEDGYGVHKAVTYETNYNVAAIAEGYRKSCRKYGIQFHDADKDFTGLGLEIWDKRALWSNPDYFSAPGFDEKTRDLLVGTGVIDAQAVYEKTNRQGEKEYDVDYDYRESADAIMRFIALSMPDDFTYEIQEPKDIPCLNDELHVDFGYGLLVP